MNPSYQIVCTSGIIANVERYKKLVVAVVISISYLSELDWLS